jgi:mgtE-like transporter
LVLNGKEEGGMAMGERVPSMDISASIGVFLRHTSAFFIHFSDLFKQAPLSLLFCSFTGLIAGISLGFMTDMLQLLPGFMILIPAAIAMRGNVYSALVSRLGTSMHMGLFSTSLKKGGILEQNARASLSLTLFLSVILGLLAKIVAEVFGMESISPFEFILISVIGGLISGFILLGIAILVSVVGYNRNWDIDNFSSPIITSAGDMITLPSLYLAAILMLSSPEKVVTIISIAFILAAILCVVEGLRSKDAIVSRIVRESMPMFFICALLEMFVGLTLDIKLHYLIAVPLLLIIIPPFLGESNALGGILSARLSSMLHLGMINPQLIPNKHVSANFIVIYFLSTLVFLLVGVLSYGVDVLLGIHSHLTFSLSLGETLGITFLAGILGATFLNLASYYVAILSFKLGLDPDNNTIPLITSLTDVIGVLCLLFAMSVFTSL